MYCDRTRPRVTLFFCHFPSLLVQLSALMQAYHMHWPDQKRTVSDMHGCSCGNKHLTQLEHWQHCLQCSFNLSLLFMQSSSSTGAHQILLDDNTHTHTWPRPIKSQLEPVLSDSLNQRAVKMEIRLNGWHGVSLPAACFIESCGNTFRGWWQQSDIRRMLQSTYLYTDHIYPPSYSSFSPSIMPPPDSPLHSLHCFILSPHIVSCITSSHQMSRSHFSFSPLIPLGYIYCACVCVFLLLPVAVACAQPGTW